MVTNRDKSLRLNPLPSFGLYVTIYLCYYVSPHPTLVTGVAVTVILDGVYFMA